MNAAELESLFQSLDRPDSDELLNTTQVRGFESIRMGKCADGHPALVFLHEEKVEGFPVRLRHVRYEPQTEYRLRGETKNVAVFRFVEGDRAIRKYFFWVVSWMLRDIEDGLTFQQFDASVQGTFELFEAMNRPAQSSVQGLWAELYIIARSAAPNRLVMLWHSKPTAQYDFALPPDRLEVKSTVGQIRTHTFSLEQLSEAKDGRTIIASLCLHESDDGASVKDLVDQISDNLSRSSQQKVLRLVASELGADWPQADQRFDQGDAEASLRFFHARNIPSVTADEGVTRVKFTSDLSQLESVPLSDLVERSLFGLMQVPT